MDCPDCLTPMTKEDASACTEDIAGTVVPAALAAIKRERPSVVAAVYFCPPCATYFRWELGVPGLMRWPFGTMVGTAQDVEHVGVDASTRRMVNEEMARRTTE